MRTLTLWILRHRWLVGIGWVLVAVVGMASAEQATNALSSAATLPSEPAARTNAYITSHFGNGGETPVLVPVITLHSGSVTSPGALSQVSATFRRLQASVPHSRAASYPSTHDPIFISRDGRTTFGIVFIPPGPNIDFGLNAVAIAAARRSLVGSTIDGAHWHLTGMDALRTTNSSGAGPSVLAETLIGGVGALLVLLFVFGSLLAIVPLLMAAVAIPTCFLLVWGVASLTAVNFTVEFLIALIGLGVSIDYSLLIVTRWREERAHGLDNQTAIVRAMETAGRAVIFSGLTVAISLLAMVAIPVPFLRSMGYGGLLIPLVSVLVATTLLPVLLAIGPRLDWPHLRHEERPSRGWIAWAGLVVRRRWISAAVGTALLALLVVPAFRLHLTDPSAASLAKAGEGRLGLHALQVAGFGAGALNPIEILQPIDGNTAALTARLERLDGVQGVIAPSGPAWERGGRRLLDVIPRDDINSDAGQATLSRVRDAVPGTVGVGGEAAQNQDFVSAVYGSFPLMALLIALLTVVLLTRVFRSILLPLKAVVLGLLSQAAVIGAMVLIWQDGRGSEAIWGIAPTGSITSWIPILVFAFLFGLSMDYEVFILSRIREEYDRTGSTPTAVTIGLGRTGRLVTSAALILFLAFMSGAATPDTESKIIATGLAVGILLDATLIRALLVPALVSVLGPWNWWLPSLPARLLRVPPSTIRVTAPISQERSEV